jgi:3-oxoacyl-[acyl-carrier protein] reductase
MQRPPHPRVVIVTGASSGLGAAVARRFAAQGDTVVLTARRADRLRSIADEINHSAKREDAALWLAGDAARQETAEAVVALAIQRFGRVDVLVNNAGLGRYCALVDTTAEQYDELMDANVRSGFVFSRAVVPPMIAQESGTIVFISSVAGLAGAPNEAVYCASKFAQVGMAQALDAELRKHGIKVQAICPGGICARPRPRCRNHRAQPDDGPCRGRGDRRVCLRAAGQRADSDHDGPAHGLEGANSVKRVANKATSKLPCIVAIQVFSFEDFA